MSLGAILSAAGLAAVLSITAGHAEVLAFDSAFVIDGVAVASDDPPVIDGSAVEADVVNETYGEELEDRSDLDRGTRAITVATESSTWVTALFSLAWFSR
jgi:hypothetical protein